MWRIPFLLAAPGRLGQRRTLNVHGKDLPTPGHLAIGLVLYQYSVHVQQQQHQHHDGSFPVTLSIFPITLVEAQTATLKEMLQFSPRDVAVAKLLPLARLW
jgi:hypothetical protein